MLRALLRLLKRNSDAPPDIPLAPSVPEQDAAEEIPLETGIVGTSDPGFDADIVHGLSFGMAYVDAHGVRSTRRITILSIRQLGPKVLILAKCHERKALRSFRFDRIVEIIDIDGVVFDDPARFFLEELDIRVDSRVEDPLPTPSPGRKQIRESRDGLRVLAAMARSDGKFHEMEYGPVLDWLDRRCLETNPCTIEDLNAVEKYLRRCRPSTEVLGQCLERIELDWDISAKVDFFTTLEQVAFADGVLADEEMAVLAEVRSKLGLVAVVG